MSGGGAGGSGETLIKKEEEEETLGQLRDRLGLVPGLARMPGPRAAFVHIKVEDTSSGEDTGGDGDGDGEGDRDGGEGEEDEEEEDKKEEEESAEEEEGDEEEAGQQREHHAQAPGVSFGGRLDAAVTALAPARRARPPPGSYEDTAVELDTDDAYKHEEEEEEEEEDWGEKEHGDEAALRDLRIQMPGVSGEGGREAVRPRSLPLSVHSEPGFPRVQQRRAPVRVADNDVQDDDGGQQEGVVPELVMRGGAGRAGASRFQGVSRYNKTNKWQTKCKGKHLGYYTTEEVAARAYSKYFKDGIAPQPAAGGPAGSSQFKGVTWDKSNNKWKATCKGTHLGYHATEEDAARAYNKYLEDGSVPAAWGSSQFKGVCWVKRNNKWKADCKGTHLGYHATEENAARAYIEYLRDGINPVQHREANTSQFTGVSWDKRRKKWRAKCKRNELGYLIKEEDAARAYNVVAGRLGVALNVIQPAGAAGADANAGEGVGADGSAGPKLAAPMTPATPATSKKSKRTTPTTPATTATSKKKKL